MTTRKALQETYKAIQLLMQSLRELKESIQYVGFDDELPTALINQHGEVILKYKDKLMCSEELMDIISVEGYLSPESFRDENDDFTEEEIKEILGNDQTIEL